MTWTRGVLAVLAVAAIGYVAMRPHDEAQYLGDFPSMFETGQQSPGAVADPPPASSADTGSTVTPPVVSSPEAPAAGRGYTGGVRTDQGPGADTATRLSPPGFEGDDGSPALGIPGFSLLPPLPPCLGDFFRPGVGIISCATGVILDPDPLLDPVTGLPIDPATGLPLDLPVL
jgi:hypothetical protein